MQRTMQRTRGPEQCEACSTGICGKNNLDEVRRKERELKMQKSWGK
jgi:hypothetical protein